MAALHQLIAIDEPGDILSPSSANGYLGCHFKWCTRYIL